jgi:putative addiction module component (TIGR02574 family)
MNTKLLSLPLDEQIQLVEDLWDSIAAEQNALPLTNDQIAEIEKRLKAYELDGNAGRPAIDVIRDLRSRL